MIHRIASCLVLLLALQLTASATDIFRIHGKDVVLERDGEEVDTLRLDGIPGSLALSPDGKLLYVRLSNENSIAVYNATTLELVDWYSLDRSFGKTRLDTTFWTLDPHGNLIFRDQQGNFVLAEQYRQSVRLAQPSAPTPTLFAATSEFDLSALNGAKSYPGVDFDSTGNFVATWTDLAGNDGSGEGVYLREFSSDTNPQGSEFRGNNGKSGDQGNSSIGSASDGDYVVVWRDSSGQDGDRFGVFGRRFNNGGSPKDSNDIKIPNTTSGNQKEPSIDVEPDGDFVVVWTGPSGTGKAVFGRRYNSSGSPKSSEFVVGSSSMVYAPDVATNSTGRFAVAWRDGSDDLVRARVYSGTGSPVTSVFKVESSTNNQFAPTVGMDDNGDFTVAWQTNAAGGIQYRQFNADGTPKGSSKSAGSGGNKDYAPSLSMEPGGKFCIAWRDDLLSAWARAFQAGGSPADDAFKPAQSGGDQLEPNCAIDADGNFLVSWKYRPGGGDGSIRGRKFGTGTSPGLTVSCTASPTSGAPPLAVDFTATASGGGGSYSYSWKFGDGSSSTSQNPSHTYDTTGTYNAVVTATSGSETATCTKTISVGEAPPPPSGMTVTGLTINSLNRGTTENIFSVKGTGFVDGATVDFHDPGVDVYVTNWIDSTRIKVRVTVTASAYLGLHDVTVTNPDSSKATGNDLLKILENGGYPAPIVSDVLPPSVSAGDTVTLTITGSGFANDPDALKVNAGSDVTVNSIQWISPGEIQANAKISTNAACGPHDVTVANGGSVSQPCVGCLSVLSNQLSIGAVSPTSLRVGQGPANVTIMGCGFTASSVAKIKGTTRIAQQFVDANTIILTVKVDPDTTPGYKRVIVKNSATEIVKRKDLFQVMP